MIYDLHSHTYFSDGKLSPEELVARARAQGVDVLAVTDHDTIAGLERAALAARNEGVGLVAGIEFSCSWNALVPHVVGLCIDPTNTDLLTQVAAQETARAARADAIAAKLHKLGFIDALAGAQTFSSDGVVGRPHFAQHLVAIGAVKDMAGAFKRYLGAGKPADAKFVWPTLGTIVASIQAAGGIAVLAHPAKYDLTRTKMCRLIDEFLAAGGNAIEIVNGNQDASTTKDLTGITLKKAVLASVGSDFHVPGSPWQELGRFSPLSESLTPVWQSPKWRFLVEPALATSSGG